jgi:hypothetical protein
MRARRTYSKETQQKVLDTYDKQKRKSCKALSLKFKIPRSTVNRWVWDKIKNDKPIEVQQALNQINSLELRESIFRDPFVEIKEIQQKIKNIWQVMAESCVKKEEVENSLSINKEMWKRAECNIAYAEVKIENMQKSNRVFMFVVTAFSVVEFALRIWLR